MAKEFQTLPSQLLSIDDPYAAWCFNEACFMWGVYVESELHQAGRDTKDRKGNKEHERALNKRKLRMTALMTEPTKPEEEGKAHPTPAPKKRFKDPADLFKKK